jgi:GT2 family glycosyltransferase
MFVRRVDFDRLGGFREDLVAAEDVDLCVRMAAASGEIVQDMRLANVHHGEPATLWQFMRKEYWRGSSGLRAFFSHGTPWHELPSLAWPAYHLVLIALAPVAAGWCFVSGEPSWIAGWALALLSPSMALAVRTAITVRRVSAILPLAILYLSYGVARAAALFKR